MKILLVNQALYPRGGAEDVMLILGRELQAQGHEVMYFAKADRRNLPCPEAGYFPPRIPSGLSSARRFHLMLRNPDASSRLTALIGENRPDLAVVFQVGRTLTYDTVKALRLAGVPTAQYLSDFAPICPGRTLHAKDAPCRRCGGWFLPCVLNSCVRGSFRASLYAALEARYLRLSRSLELPLCYLAPSDYHRMLFEQAGFTRRPVLSAELPLPPEAFASAGGRHGRYFLYVGSLVRRKGLQTLLRALTQCVCSLPLVVAGDGPDREEMTELMARLGLGERVRLLGQRPIAEIRGLMADCLCLVAPSECEEIGPVSLLEAQALGKPAIVSDRGVLPDRVKDGRTGLIFPAGDSLALAQRLDDLAALSQAEYARMSGCAREEAAARYAPSAFAARIIALSERFADEYPGGEERHGQTTAE